MPEVLLRRPTPADASELGRICFEAFDDISRKHGFETDINDPAVWQRIMSALVSNENVYGAAAEAGGALAGSNFLAQTDEVGGIGPITVDVRKQGLGIGRKLMEDALAYAREQGIEMVRLVQEAFNMTSMSLYTSLGFDTRVPLGLFSLKPAPAPHPHVRAIEPGDRDATDALCREIYRVNRRSDLDRPTLTGQPPWVIERGGRVRGYLISGISGHGVAESDDDIIALLGEAARQAPVAISQLLPLTNGNLVRKALAAGHRLKKPMNLMALGPYEEPHRAWVPSILF